MKTCLKRRTPKPINICSSCHSVWVPIQCHEITKTQRGFTAKKGSRIIWFSYWGAHNHKNWKPYRYSTHSAL